MADTDQQGENSRCARCGRRFHCGFNDPGGSCWCATEFPKTLRGENDAKSCLCPDCLRREVSSRAVT